VFGDSFLFVHEYVMEHSEIMVLEDASLGVVSLNPLSKEGSHAVIRSCTRCCRSACKVVVVDLWEYHV
jgi:hypothetical protein